MKKQNNGKKKTPALSVSRKFYVETMTRVRDAMSAVNAGCQETYEMEVYISDYLRSGLQPKRELENRQLLVMMLLKPEIDKAIARSAKARSRTKKERETPSRPLTPEAPLSRLHKSPPTPQEAKSYGVWGVKKKKGGG
ncbi:MAG: hypothetical protein K2H17_08660, partial [Duncaniella sp.]|uniref:hypothetical protein n=1 Tax=Duncaniella sp. TaxID=2518496 RepID=UPI0023D4EBB9